MASSIDLTAFDGMPLQDIIRCTYDVMDCVCPLCLAGLRELKTKNNFAQHVGVHPCLASSKKPGNHKCAQGGTEISVQALAILSVYVLELDAIKKPELAAYKYVGAAAFLCHVLKARNLLPVEDPSQMPPRNELVEKARKKLQELVDMQHQRDQAYAALQKKLPDFLIESDVKDPSPTLVKFYPALVRIASRGRNRQAHRQGVIANHQEDPSRNWIVESWEDLQVLLSLALLLEGQPDQDTMSMASMLDEEEYLSEEDVTEEEEEEVKKAMENAKAAAKAAAAKAAATIAAKAAAKMASSSAAQQGASASRKAVKRRRFQEIEAEKQAMEEDLLVEVKNAADMVGFLDFMAEHMTKSAAEVNNQGGPENSV